MVVYSSIFLIGPVHILRMKFSEIFDHPLTKQFLILNCKVCNFIKFQTTQLPMIAKVICEPPLITVFLFQTAIHGPNAGYFVEETLLNRVPNLLLILAGLYLLLGISGSLMICQPPEDWVQRKSFSKLGFDQNSIELNAENEKPMLVTSKNNSDDSYVSWKDALKMKEFYLLWITRLSVVLITQVNPN